MFDLLEENLNIQENEEEENARTSVPRSGALFSMPEKFLTQEDVKKKGHPLVPILSVFIAILVVASVGLAFAIQNKNLQLAKESAVQEAARAATLQAQQENTNTTSPSEENIPFQITEPIETPTIAEAVTSTSATSTEAVAPIQEATSTTAAVTSTEKEIVTFGLDTDKDKLSDIEERLYKTDPKKPDTDMDGILDGAELKNLYDPTKGEGALLKDSGLISTYVNQNYQYSFFYPNFPDEWAVSALDQTQKEVMVSAVTGEYVSIRVEENPQKLSVSDWYTTIFAVGKPSEQIQSMSFNQWNALMREDGRVYYMVRKDEHSEALTPYVYVITYMPNAKKELNYLTTFQMLVKSFSPLQMTVSLQQ